MFLRLLLTSFTLAFTVNAHAQFDARFYHARYGLTDVDQKLVNNRGDGHENLYGTRNFREVLAGVLFRGGANNAYHRERRRDNSNPLPADGLTNLCQEGFRNAVYMYPTNFSTAQPRTSCDSLRGPNVLTYRQLSFSSQTHEILALIHAAIVNPENGPVYVHCWNGWHAAGMVSAFALRQFCGWSGDAAVAYWTRNADGTDNGGYESLKRKIRSFTPYAEFAIDPATRAVICPN